MTTWRLELRKINLRKKKRNNAMTQKKPTYVLRKKAAETVL